MPCCKAYTRWGSSCREPAALAVAAAPPQQQKIPTWTAAKAFVWVYSVQLPPRATYTEAAAAAAETAMPLPWTAYVRSSSITTHPMGGMKSKPHPRLRCRNACRMMNTRWISRPKSVWGQCRHSAGSQYSPCSRAGVTGTRPGPVSTRAAASVPLSQSPTWTPSLTCPWQLVGGLVDPLRPKSLPAPQSTPEPSS